jgi:hypothetical protein
VTPDLAVRATLATAAAPALVWLPPAQWQPGDMITVTTGALHLPHTFAVRAADEPVAIFRRGADGVLARLPDDLAATPDLRAALTPIVGALTGATATVQMADGATRAVRAWLPDRPVWPGAALDVWLQWEGAAWPDNLAAFVHLRHDGANVAQADGPPRFFGDAVQASNAAATGHISDWRQVQIPADAATAGGWQVVVGLYDPATGARTPLTLRNGVAGDELVVGTLHMTTPPAPDQACALLPATCASQ